MSNFCITLWRHEGQRADLNPVPPWGGQTMMQSFKCGFIFDMLMLHIALGLICEALGRTWLGSLAGCVWQTLWAPPHTHTRSVRPFSLGSQYLFNNVIYHSLGSFMHTWVHKYILARVACLSSTAQNWCFNEWCRLALTEACDWWKVLSLFPVTWFPGNCEIKEPLVVKEKYNKSHHGD